MELQDLNADERIALVGLMKEVVMADRKCRRTSSTRSKRSSMPSARRATSRRWTPSTSRFLDQESFQRFLATITRQEARELIYGNVLQAAAADAIEGRESELLSWLADVWNIEVKIDGRPTATARRADGLMPLGAVAASRG